MNEAASEEWVKMWNINTMSELQLKPPHVEELVHNFYIIQKCKWSLSLLLDELAKAVLAVLESALKILLVRLQGLDLLLAGLLLLTKTIDNFGSEMKRSTSTQRNLIIHEISVRQPDTSQNRNKQISQIALNFNKAVDLLIELIGLLVFTNLFHLYQNFVKFLCHYK